MLEKSKKNLKPSKTINCEDCGQNFEFTGGEQDFYESKNLEDPKRCKKCRDKRKTSYAERRR